MIEVTVKHNFETGHRLPHLPGKCQNLHGHSWWAAITVGSATVGPSGIVIDFGSLKGVIREWIDTNLDHGLMLGAEDPLVPLLSPHGKVFVFGPELGDWPTVENVAAMLTDVVQEALYDFDADPAVGVLRVVVRETHVNEASWTT